ncbi:MAG: hypothetical protein KME25_03850 [Symplocastrum torsivum CPER-KK1]|jgi:hypothetical protein|uniref:Uncharacterized protein n=1 Tax=Symplocastrum torsivum CPER-KK1 TaxID=450513 RepID=A0A951PIJ9_9CYAN|nr:hypothetical protein [Symplocastrum torsivum CPER-KK1]
MTLPSEKASKSSMDIRLPATSIIWGFATGMLALCLPLSNDTNHGTVISIAIVSAAAVSTVAVWQSSDKKSQTRNEASDRVKEFKERIANLEMIASSDHTNWQGKTQAVMKSDRK